jgi:hypothetical protein
MKFWLPGLLAVALACVLTFYTRSASSEETFQLEAIAIDQQAGTAVMRIADIARIVQMNNWKAEEIDRLKAEIARLRPLCRGVEI